MGFRPVECANCQPKAAGKVLGGSRERSVPHVGEVLVGQEVLTAARVLLRLAVPGRGSERTSGSAGADCASLHS